MFQVHAVDAAGNAIDKRPLRRAKLLDYFAALAANDDHILNRMGRGRFRTLYVGVYGDPLSDENQNIMARAGALADQRPARWPLEVRYYDAASAQVWG